MMCIRDMVSEVRDMRLERSLTARIGISRQGEPTKSLSFHKSCSTPILKVIIVMLSVMLTMAMICCIMKKCRCRKVNSEE